MTKTANSKLEDADRTKGSTPSTGAPTSGNDTKQTPLHLAVRNGKEGVVKALLKKGTDKHAEDKDGKTALVKGHASTETLDENQDTLLHQAVREGQEAAVSTVPLDLHAKIEAKDSNGKTPLENSIKNGQKSITKILVDKNANTELVQLDGNKEAQDCEGRMPLRKAVSNGHAEIARFPVQPKANMEARTILNYPLPVLNYPLPNEYYYDIPIRSSSYPMALQRSNGSTDSTWSNTTPVESYQSRHSYQPYGRAGYTASTQATSQYPSYDSTSRSQSNGDSKEPQYCWHKDCLDPNGRPTRQFTRKADVHRHHKSTHDKQYIDHQIEHLRGYHGEDIAKRPTSHASRAHSRDA